MHDSPVMIAAHLERRGRSPRRMFSRTVSAISSALWPVAILSACNNHLLSEMIHESWSLFQARGQLCRRSSAICPLQHNKLMSCRTNRCPLALDQLKCREVDKYCYSSSTTERVKCNDATCAMICISDCQPHCFSLKLEHKCVQCSYRSRSVNLHHGCASV